MYVGALAAAFLAMMMAVLPAAADPVGRYTVVGDNPDSGGKYRGTVQVSRTGKTYKVVWKIAGTTYVGTGLGAVIRDGKFNIGAAEPSDSILSVGYVSGRTFGMAFYIEQPDGSWEGVWTYGGSRKVAREQWFR
ncbi:MAG: hypothetical protein C0606_11805 [Hyphomicrobiales bacterium]|nr:MAG: hypothetical protein C0606_11805 [Hyphomicrobiales bacterium]